VVKSTDISRNQIEASITPPCDDVNFILQARSFIEQNNLELCTTGCGGTYYVKNDRGDKVAIFKPADEEPGAVNNPKKIVVNVSPVGNGSIREVAANILDHNFAGVPATYLLNNLLVGDKVYKTGSLQKFVGSIGDASSIGCINFPVDDVHAIGILDIRLMNTDRNGENILVNKENGLLRLVPIDHGGILPSKIESIWFEWMTWRQAKQPFSKRSLEFIQSIDIEQDARTLSSLSVEEESIQIMKISTTLLKFGAHAGLTLYEIASCVCRKRPREKSELELIVDANRVYDRDTILSIAALVERKQKEKLPSL